MYIGGGADLAGVKVTTDALTSLNIASATFDLSSQVVNNGHANWISGDVAVNNGSSIVNAGDFQITCDQKMTTIGGGTFQNAGTLEKAASAFLSFTDLQVTFYNGPFPLPGGGPNASVTVKQDGWLKLSGGGTSDCPFTINAGGLLEFAEGKQTLYAGASFSGDGRFLVDDGCDADVEDGSNIPISTGNFALMGTAGFVPPTLDGSPPPGSIGIPNGAFTITGAADWDSGSGLMNATVTVLGAVDIGNSGLAAPATMVGSQLWLMGPTTWDSNENIRMTGSAINNGGTFTAANAQTIQDQNRQAPSSFNNLGSFVKQAGTAPTEIDANFTNQGALSFNGANIRFGDNVQQTAASAVTDLGGGRMTLLGNTPFLLSAGELAAATGGVIDGDLTNAGQIDFGAAYISLLITGNYTQAAGGTLVINCDGAGQIDMLTVYGQATLGGHLVINGPTGSAAWQIIQANGGVANTFADVTAGWTVNYFTNQVWIQAANGQGGGTGGQTGEGTGGGSGSSDGGSGSGSGTGGGSSSGTGDGGGSGSGTGSGGGTGDSSGGGTGGDGGGGTGGDGGGGTGGGGQTGGGTGDGGGSGSSGGGGSGSGGGTGSGSGTGSTGSDGGSSGSGSGSGFGSGSGSSDGGGSSSGSGSSDGSGSGSGSSDGSGSGSGSDSGSDGSGSGFGSGSGSSSGSGSGSDASSGSLMGDGQGGGSGGGQDAAGKWANCCAGRRPTMTYCFTRRFGDSTRGGNQGEGAGAGLGRLSLGCLALVAALLLAAPEAARAAKTKPTAVLDFGEKPDVRGLAVSPDGNTLAIQDKEKREVALWDIKTKTQTAVLKPKDWRPCGHVAFTPDGAGVLVDGLFFDEEASDTRWSVHLWDVATQKDHTALVMPTNGSCDWVQTPDGKSLIVGTRGDGVHVFDLQTGKETKALPCDESPQNTEIRVLALRPTARRWPWEPRLGTSSFSTWRRARCYKKSPSWESVVASIFWRSRRTASGSLPLACGAHGCRSLIRPPAQSSTSFE